MIPPAYGLAGIHRITVTGDGDEIAYWNRYVGVTQMGGHGTFSEPRTGVNVTNGNGRPDQQQAAGVAGVSAVAWRRRRRRRAASTPRPRHAARSLFDGTAGCAACHSGPAFTDANARLHPPAEVVSEPEPDGVPSYASRSATKQYRTAPLRGVWQHPPYFHNGSAPTLEAVVQTYNSRKSLGLSAIGHLRRGAVPQVLVTGARTIHGNE